MRRAAIAAVLATLVLVSIALAQELTPQAYLPLVQKPPPTNTAVPTPTATTGPVPTATPTQLPPSFASCSTPPANPGSAPHYPVRIVSIDKASETVTLRNTSTDTVDLGGWRMCSITGGQEHPIGGALAPGETKVFGNLGGPIWNNSTPDPGALYDPGGHLVSYLDA